MPETRKIRELDSLRGIAIALVYCFHAYGQALAYRAPSEPPSLLWVFVSSGHTGVSLFFVLSAYLLSRPIFSAMGDGLDWRRFYRRRIRRIMPMYVLAVSVTTLFCAQRPSDLLRGVPHLLFLSGYGPWAPALIPFPEEPIWINSHWWSLHTEAQFYVALPLLAVALRSRARLAMLALVGAGAYAAFIGGAAGRFGFDVVWSLTASLVGRGPVFLFGIVAAWIDERHRDAAVRLTTALGRWGSTLALVVTVALLGRLLQWTETMNTTLRDIPPFVAWHAAEGLLWAVMLLLLLRAPIEFKSVAVNRVWTWIGERSYSIYLIHAPLLFVGIHLLRFRWPQIFGRMTPGTWSALGGLTVVCLALSSATYAWVELPFLAHRTARPGRSRHPAERARSDRRRSE